MVNGILLLDKPKGLSSNAVLQKMKRLFQARKAGHTGSLDPLATGMLPICFGEATKFSQYLLGSDKTYCVTMQLGVRTTTGDAEGDVIAVRDVSHINAQTIHDVLNTFRGITSQIPPMFSALKFHGKPLYRLARQGITVERQSRFITIHDLSLISFEHHCITFSVRCSKGTYIRTLVDDIGEKLNCGAYVKSLRRVSVGQYTENQMINLPQWENVHFFDFTQYLLPIESMVNHCPEVMVSPSMIFYLKRGQSIMLSQAPGSGFLRLVQANGQFVGLGEVVNGKIAPRRIIK